MKNIDLKVIGLKIKYYVSIMEMKTKYILCCIDNYDNKKIVVIDRESIEIKKVDNFNGFSMWPTVILNITKFEKIDNPLYLLENSLKLFKKTTFYKEKRPVWIFVGSSNYGKNIISHNTNISVFDLKKHNFLPDLIECDIIVMGEDNYYTIDDVKSRCIGGIEKNEFIIVNFKKPIDNFQYNIFNNYNNHIKYNYVLIFIGNHNIGKSYIANSIMSYNVYEVDEKLPPIINDSTKIIVTNTIFNHSINDITSRINKNRRIIYVNFIPDSEYKDY